jgi:hypothetical protein
MLIYYMVFNNRSEVPLFPMREDKRTTFLTLDLAKKEVLNYHSPYETTTTMSLKFLY